MAIKKKVKKITKTLKRPAKKPPLTKKTTGGDKKKTKKTFVSLEKRKVKLKSGRVIDKVHRQTYRQKGNEYVSSGPAVAVNSKYNKDGTITELPVSTINPSGPAPAPSPRASIDTTKLKATNLADKKRIAAAAAVKAAKEKAAASKPPIKRKKTVATKKKKTVAKKKKK